MSYKFSWKFLPKRYYIKNNINCVEIWDNEYDVKVSSLVNDIFKEDVLLKETFGIPFWRELQSMVLFEIYGYEQAKIKNISIKEFWEWYFQEGPGSIEYLRNNREEVK